MAANQKSFIEHQIKGAFSIPMVIKEIKEEMISESIKQTNSQVKWFTRVFTLKV